MIIIIKFAFFLGCFAASAAENLKDFSESNQPPLQSSLETPAARSIDPYIQRTIQNFYPTSPPWLLQEAIDKQEPLSRKQSCDLIFEKIRELDQAKKHSLAATLCLVLLNSQSDLNDQRSAVNYLFMLSVSTSDALIDLENFVKVNKKDESRKEIWAYACLVLRGMSHPSQ